jgi:hypothetical protein
MRSGNRAATRACVDIATQQLKTKCKRLGGPRIFLALRIANARNCGRLRGA